MENNYRVLIKMGSLKFEVESTEKDWVEKKQKELEKSFKNAMAEPKAVVHETPSESSQSSTYQEDIKEIKVSITINEFYRKYCMGFKASTDVAVFFIYYLAVVQKKQDIAAKDIKGLFIKVGIPRANSLNYSLMLLRAKQRALLNQINNKWSLTITGEDFVINKIQSKAKK